jgi:hypothetical protein
MSYIINNTNGDQIAVVADGTIDTTLDIKLIGKNYAGYGEAQNENFVFLLENFSHPYPPAKAVKGQIWFDSGTSKLKFFDSSKWRTTGGAEIGDSAPAGLTVGDMWFDTSQNQLNTWDGEQFVLIGPQAAGTQTTEMLSKNVRDASQDHTSHAIIQGIVNGETIFIISRDSVFTLDDMLNPIAGFTKIQKGITLRNTNDDLQPGQTITDHRFWGTATNADRLGGHLPSDFALSNNASFTSQVHFSEAGLTVGGSSPDYRLWIYNEAQTSGGTLIPIIHNKVSDQIIFKTTVNNSTKTPLKIVGIDVLPGEDNVSTIGTSTNRFNKVYATLFKGTSDQADALSVGGTYRTASIDVAASTIVARTSVNETINGVATTAGSIKATYFVGTATSAYYADLAEKYLADRNYEVGTVVMVGGEKEVTACQPGNRALGTISENPAYMMNSHLEGGIYIALKGRVPVKVSGPITNGDRLVAGENGTAVASSYAIDIFAIALESSNDSGVKIIEAVIL